MQKKTNSMTKSANLSRQSSQSSQSSNSNNKIAKRDSYISLSPRFDPNKGLAFQKEIKDNTIKSLPDDDTKLEPQQNSVLKKQTSFTSKSIKDEQMKKSQFSRIHRADSLQAKES